MKQRLHANYVTTALLLVLTLLLVWVIGGELGWGQRIRLPLPQPALIKKKEQLTALQAEFVLPPLEQAYTEMVARPLFVPTRRPPPPPADVKPPPPAMRKNQFMLVGVIITKEKKIALLREVANGKVMRVEQGTQINGIELEKVEPEKVTLKQWDDREEVLLKIQAQPRPPPMPPMLIPGQGGIPGQAAPGMPPPPPVNMGGMPNSLQSEIARRRGIVP